MQTDVHDKFIPGTTRIKYGGAYTDQADFDAINSVLERNWWTIDEECRLLEEELGLATDSKHVVITNSGSSALLVGINALNLPENSEVITGAVHFPTSITSLYYNRLKPVFVDNNEVNLGIDPDLIEQAITKKTSAILVVSIAGSIPDMPKIRDIADRHNLKVIHDNCDGHGSKWAGRPIEFYADITCTSFHAAHIMAMGEGGAVFTNDDVVGEKARSLREWGRVGDTDDTSQYTDMPSDYPGRYIFKYLGFNLKPLELQCAMGRSQLKKLDKIKRLRQENYDYLYRHLSWIPQVQLLETFPGAEPSWFAFPMIAKNRPELRAFLESRQIETRTIFGGNITKQPAFKNIGRKASQLPVADRIMTEGMFLSVHPACTEEMMRYMVDSVREFYA